jgi:hypothetical protein
MFFVSMANSLKNRFTSPVTRRHGPPFSCNFVADNRQDFLGPALRQIDSPELVAHLEVETKKAFDLSFC